MAAIRGKIRNGKVEFDSPPAWPEGAEVLVVDPVIPSAPAEPFRMLTEEEQGDDPESIARWLAWLDSLEAARSDPEEEAELAAWGAKVKAFNLEAVRKQMAEGFE